MLYMRVLLSDMRGPEPTDVIGRKGRNRSEILSDGDEGDGHISKSHASPPLQFAR